MKWINLLITIFFISTCVFAASSKTETAIFAGGCFWSMQHDFNHLPGVIGTTVGYTGGGMPHPSYKQVSYGTTGHYEAIRIVYDPAKVSYKQLLDFYWRDTDPTNSTGQFCDTGPEYRPVIFYMNNDQKKIADQSKSQLIQSKQFKEIATQILPANTFYPAEDYHQHYADKYPREYNTYRTGCRRDSTRDAVWGN